MTSPAESPPTILGLAEALLSAGRGSPDRKRLASALGSAIETARMTLSKHHVLVTGEEGEINVNRALSDLVDGPKDRIACWMLARIVAAGVAAGHEAATSEIVDPALENELHDRFTSYGQEPSHTTPRPVYPPTAIAVQQLDVL